MDSAESHAAEIVINLLKMKTVSVIVAVPLLVGLPYDEIGEASPIARFAWNRHIFLVSAALLSIACTSVGIADFFSPCRA